MNEYIKSAGILDEMLSSGKHLDDCFDSGASPLVQQICYGVTRHYYYLSAILDLLLKKPLPDKHGDLHCLLLAGLYSIDHLRRPAHASVNATVEATTGLKKAWAKGLVNGILRRYGRESEKLRTRLANENTEALHNHPNWLIDEIRQAWPEQWQSILQANQAQAPMTLRVNQRSNTVDEYLALLDAEGLGATVGQLAATAVILDTAVGVSFLPGFGEGRVSVQDEAAQLTAPFLHLEPGLRVLDACAAPGGKTCHLLEAADVKVTAIDRDRKRIGHIHENLERLSLAADVEAVDLETYRDESGFDRILLDAPCSATGIIRRHPDIKLLRMKSDVAKLADIQQALLNKAFDLLKPGGELLYSTCSILPRENEDMIAAFLEKTPAAIAQPLPLPESNTVIATANGLQLLPTIDQHDGFYYASIRKAV